MRKIAETPDRIVENLAKVSGLADVTKTEAWLQNRIVNVHATLEQDAMQRTPMTTQEYLSYTLGEARAMLAELEASKWLPIEGGPMSGQCLLLFPDGEVEPGFAEVEGPDNNVVWIWGWKSTHECRDRQPAHYQPLPAGLPATEETSTDA